MLQYVMEFLHQTFRKTIIQVEANKLPTARKNPKRSWPEHLLYLVAVSDATSGAKALVLENIFQYASTDRRHVFMAKYDNSRMDYLRHAEELVHFRKAIETDVRGAKATEKDVVLNVGAAQPRNNTRTCYNCNKIEPVAVV